MNGKWIMNDKKWMNLFIFINVGMNISIMCDKKIFTLKIITNLNELMNYLNKKLKRNEMNWNEWIE